MKKTRGSPVVGDFVTHIRDGRSGLMISLDGEKAVVVSLGEHPETKLVHHCPIGEWIVVLPGVLSLEAIPPNILALASRRSVQDPGL